MSQASDDLKYWKLAAVFFLALAALYYTTETIKSIWGKDCSGCCEESGIKIKAEFKSETQDAGTE
jgi:hypothetical protein